MANPEHVEIVKRGKEAIDEWGQENPGVGMDLSGADLREANLRGADLVRATLWHADFREANLGRANLRATNLVVANLSGANLSRAQLIRANLTSADLTKSDLKRAALYGTAFRGSSLRGSDFHSAVLVGTVFADCDLANALNLDKVKHNGPSTIGIDTIFRSGGKIPEEFLWGAGVPEEIIRAIPSLVGSIQHDSCSIGYGEPDKEFAEQLNRDLTTKTISCWTYFMDYTLSEHTQTEIKREAPSGGQICRFVLGCRVT